MRLMLYLIFACSLSFTLQGCGSSDEEPIENKIHCTTDSQIDPATCDTYGSIFFDSGSYALTDSAQVALNSLADVLLINQSIIVEVEAYTDSIEAPIDLDAIDLAKNRALAAIQYLILAGVPSDQLSARAFGNTEQLSDSEESPHLNSRVVFRVK